MYFYKRLFETNPKVPNMTGLDEVENLMTSRLVFDDVTFSGSTCTLQKYIVYLMLKF